MTKPGGKRGGKGTPVLTEAQRIKAIQMQACFSTPTETRAALQAEWPDLVISIQAIDGLNPLTYQGRNLAARWRIIFEETRKAFLADITRIGIANPAVRLQELAGIASRAKTKKNDVLLMSALEQAAKESGGAYTNKLRVTGKDDDTPVQHEHSVTLEDAKAAMTSVLSWLK